MKKSLRWLLLTAGFAVVCYMAWGLIFSDHGYLVYQQEAKQFQQLQDEVKRLKQQREALAGQILRLRNDPAALEALVHRELGYVHQDEFMLIMPEGNKDMKGVGKP